MLKKIIDEESIAKYAAVYDAGRILFFEGDESRGLYIVYRTDTVHPMGRPFTEIANALRRGAESVGWVIFQMNMALIKKA
jgi:hypothetical protein